MSTIDNTRPKAGYRGRGLHQEIVETLATAIVGGEMKEDDLLDVDDLCRRFQVSRTVAREAVKVLAAKGMVDARQNRGTFVRNRQDWALLDPDLVRWQSAAEPSDTMMRALNELRALVEPGAARLAALRADTADDAALGSALANYATAANTPDQAAEADVAFHGAVLQATNNEFLVRLRDILSAALLLRDQHVVRQVSDDPIPGHRAVLDAIQARDPDAAEQAMREIVMRAEDHEEIARRMPQRDSHPPDSQLTRCFSR
jgi:DNA-binding FadR family transcriptional regulator